MAETTGVAEKLIEHEMGCGAFQIIAVCFLYCTSILPIVCSVMMMAFGSYNPGWRCLDNSTHDRVNDTGVMSFTDYRKDRSCQLFKTCQHVEFNPETSTIVTEWHLLCDKDWVPSLIISIQMAGLLVGSLIAGQSADTIGRKKTFFGGLFINALINCVSIFSVSWHMFIALRFFIGMSCACVLSLFYVYPSEFVTRKWRAPISGFPAWSIAGIVFGAIGMALKNWRHFQIVTSFLCIVCFIPVVWFPESLRWLEVKNKREQFRRVAGKIANLNKIPLPRIDSSELVTQHRSGLTSKKNTILDLLHPGYKLYTMIISFHYFSLSIIYYAIGFGIGVLSGNIYENLMIVNAMSIPFAVFPAVAPNILGRKRALFICFSMMTGCLGVAACFELLTTGRVREIGSVVFIVGAVAGTDICWSTEVVLITEIYPTVVRALAFTWLSTVSRIGGIISPFIIPRDSGNVYVWYLVMGFLGFVCCCLVMFLPETKGKPLKQTFDQSEPDVTESSVSNHLTVS